MYTIGFHLQKGGVGKTTIAGNVACLLSKRGYKTLVVDADPQGNLTAWLAGDPELELVDVLNGKIDLEDAVVRRESLDILGTNPLSRQLVEWAGTKSQSYPMSFMQLKNEAADLGYEFLVFDLAPSAGTMERSIIGSLDEVITPLLPEYFSTEGIHIFTGFLKDVERGYGRIPSYSTIVINAINKSYVHHAQFQEAIKSAEGFVFISIPQDIEIAKAQALCQSLYQFNANNSRSLPAFVELTQRIIDNAK